MSRFSEFSDSEVYMLKRQAIEASSEIMFGDQNYTKPEIDIHERLLNEIVEELKARDHAEEGE